MMNYKINYVNRLTTKNISLETLITKISIKCGIFENPSFNI